MLARRLLLVAASFLLMGAILSAFAPRERTERATAPARTTVTAPAAESSGELPADKVVKATEGDIVTVTVTSSTPDVAEIPALGIQTDVSGDLPGELEFVADRTGTFPVTLVGTGAVLGRVVVDPR